jgi:hypothetical protein
MGATFTIPLLLRQGALSVQMEPIFFNRLQSRSAAANRRVNPASRVGGSIWVLAGAASCWW